MLNNATANLMLDAIVSAYGDMDVALSITTPILSGGSITNITEPAGATGYSRAAILSTDWDSASNRSKTTLNDITFPAPAADWGTVGHVVLYNGTTPVLFARLTSSVNVQAGGSSVRIPAGTISITLPE